jgi:hypothetical protein
MEIAAQIIDNSQLTAVPQIRQQINTIPSECD